MATQVIEIDAAAPRVDIRVRDDVRHVLVLVTAAGVPVALQRLCRPSDGLLKPDDVISFAKEGRDQPAREPLSSSPMSIVICTHERPDDLARCLESLARASAAGHEILVVDNAPRSERTAKVAEHFGVHRVVEPRLGLNRARNRGVSESAHSIVAFVDDDVAVSPSWPVTMSRSFEDPAVACATGLVLPLELETDGQEQFELYCQQRRDLRPRVYSRHQLRASAAGVVGMGANMAFRRDVVGVLGGFDERLGPPAWTRAGDETDMFARIIDGGYRIVYNPDAYVWHRHRRSLAEVRACVFGYGVGVYSVLTKRIVENRDAGALITAARWFAGPLIKRARASVARRQAAAWNIVLAETAGAVVGPCCFGYEAWIRRR